MVQRTYRSGWQVAFSILVPAICLVTVATFQTFNAYVIVASVVLLAVVPLVERHWDRRDAKRAAEQIEQGKLNT